MMNRIIKLIIDKDIPFIKGVLEPYAEVAYLDGKDITREIVAGAGAVTETGAYALIIRTRTKCDEALLSGSRVKAIFSATIGTDHIDTDYCAANGIAVHSAPGCNAWGVVQYVMTSLYVLAQTRDIDIEGKVLGIIGAGNVGERLARFAIRLGFKVMRYDPPKEQLLINTPNIDYHTLDDVLSCADIISVHLPLNSETYAFCSGQFFEKIKKGAIFINSSRGEVVDDTALLSCCNLLKGLIIDVWRGEPDINRELLAAADIATPHIAGYSLEGKINATTMVVKSFAGYFGIESLKNFTLAATKASEMLSFDYHESRCTNLAKIFTSSYDVFRDDTALRKNPELFEYLRANYIYRNEFSDRLVDFVSLYE